jgi:hypothetical protein
VALVGLERASKITLRIEEKNAGAIVVQQFGVFPMLTLTFDFSRKRHNLHERLTFFATSRPSMMNALLDA